MQDFNLALRSHRKPPKTTELSINCLTVHFNQVISYLRLIDSQLFVNIPMYRTTVPNLQPRISTV